MFVPVALRMKYYSVLTLTGLAFVACSGSHPLGVKCDFRTSAGYATMPLREGYSKLIMNAKEADEYVQQSLRVLCNPCSSDAVGIEWEIRNVSEESIEVYGVNQPSNFLGRGLSSSTYFDVENSEGNEVEYSHWYDSHFDSSKLPSDGRCFPKETRDVNFIPLKPGESFVFRTNLATTYRFEPGEYRVRYRGPFSRRWNTKWAEFKVVE